MRPLVPLALPALALILLASPLTAQTRPTTGARITYPSTHNFSWEQGSSLWTNMPPACRHGCFHGGFAPVFVVERPLDYARDERVVIVEREVVREAGSPPPSAKADGPPPRSGEDRKPYVIGASYASLPGGCMKLIEEGVSYYYCSGDWYRQTGWGRSATYKAVARP